MNQSNMLNYKSIIQAISQKTAETTVDDVVASFGLVASSVFGLFVNTRPSSLFKKIIRVETKTDSSKRKIIYYAKDIDCSRTLDLLENMKKEEIQDIGADFFYITSRKIAKNQSIEKYANFVFYMFKYFGFDSQFIRNYFTNYRDIDEVVAFLEHVTRWDIEGYDELVARTVFSCLDKLSQFGQVDDLLDVIEKFNTYIKPHDSFQGHLQKFLINSVYHTINRGMDKEALENLFETYKELGYEYTQFVCNKLLDIMNKNLKNDGFTDVVLAFMEKYGLDANIITYNTIMDYYCITGNFEKAYQLYRSLSEKGISPDSFTFSILIKGVKSMDEPDIGAACALFEEYKNITENKDIILYNNILDVLVSANQVDKVAAIMKDIEDTEDIKADNITYNIIIRGYCKNKEFENAYKYFTEMRESGYKPNRICYNTLMDLAVKVERMESALKILEDMQEDEVSADSYTYSIILNGLKINDSSIRLIENSLKKVQAVLEDNVFKLDDIFFNSIFELCVKYDLFDFMQYFYDIMKAKKVRESSVTYGILLKGYCKTNDFKKAVDILEKMLDSGIAINEITYGSVLDSCTKSGNMELSLQLYHVLKKTQSNLSSIVFTTLLSGYIKANKYSEGIEFFNSIKHHKNLTGMLITYNCALDALVRMNDMEKAYNLFEEIENTFNADIISYSTIIKGLCQNGRKKDALECTKSMVNNLSNIDVSVINLLLDSCATPNDYKLAIQAYQYAMMKNIVPNEVTFGIMVKVFGFSRELNKAFDLLDLMAVYEIEPSIIVYTNLIHISFYNKSPKKAEVAFTLFKKAGLKGDRLLYSKLITGLCKFKESQKVNKYLEYVISDGCGLKPDCIELLYDIFEGEDDILDKISSIQELSKNKKEVSMATNNNNKLKNKNNIKSKQVRAPVAQQKPPKKTDEELIQENSKPARRFDVSKAQQAPFKSTKNTHFGNNNSDSSKKPLGLFNFRQKKTN